MTANIHPDNIHPSPLGRKRMKDELEKQIKAMESEGKQVPPLIYAMLEAAKADCGETE